MTDHNMDHLTYLEAVAAADVAEVRRKEATYMGSWKRRGGVGAFMMLARKWDRLEEMLRHHIFNFDIFGAITAQVGSDKLIGVAGEDGTALAEVRDLRRYLMLVEAEMMTRGVVPPLSPPLPPLPPVPPDLPEGKGQHARMVTEDEPQDGRRQSPPWPSIISKDPISQIIYYNVDRRIQGMKRPAMLQVELNAKEYELSELRYRGMYDWTMEGEGKYRLRAEYRQHWGRR